LDEGGPVSLTVDLGEVHTVDAVKIAWEFPAKSFTVSVSVDGESWDAVYGSTVNVADVTSISTGGKSASKVRVTMQEALPAEGHALYGIKSLRVLAPRLQAVGEDCATAAKSSYARDKYFASPVTEFDSAAAQPLLDELPQLEEAAASLSRAVSDVVEVIPKLALCKTGSS